MEKIEAQCGANNAADQRCARHESREGNERP